MMAELPQSWSFKPLTLVPISAMSGRLLDQPHSSFASSQEDTEAEITTPGAQSLSTNSSQEEVEDEITIMGARSVQDLVPVQKTLEEHSSASQCAFLLEMAQVSIPLFETPMS